MKPIEAATTIKPAADWKIAGTSVLKVDGRDFVTGKHQYTSDVQREGMLHGRVLRDSVQTAYNIWSTHNGNSTYYCYASNFGGSVKSEGSTKPSNKVTAGCP